MRMRIRLEADAIYLILEHVREAVYTLIVSPAHFAEIAATTHEQEGAQLLAFLDAYGNRPSWDLAKARERAEELYRLKFGPADAAHVAFAEQAAAVFVTCDDALLKKSRRAKIKAVAMGPIEFSISEGLK